MPFITSVFFKRLLYHFLLFIFAIGPGYAFDNGFFSLKEIRERGVVMQKWENSCAAASIATVLTYGFHDPVSESDVAGDMLLGVEPRKVKNRGGFSLLEMKRYIESRGYKADAYKNLSLTDLVLFNAAIVPINKFGMNHYVVFNYKRGNKIFLSDPSYGNREMDIAEFQQVWMNGIAFVITKMELQ